MANWNASVQLPGRPPGKAVATRPPSFFEGDDPSDLRNVSYRELHEQVCKLPRVEQAKGLKKGDVSPVTSDDRPKPRGLCWRVPVWRYHSVALAAFSPEALAPGWF